MIRKNDVRQLLESSGSPQAFCRRMSHYMGLSDENGNEYRARGGHQELRDPRDNGSVIPRLKPDEFSIMQLGRGILGDDLFEQLYDPDSRRIGGLQSRIRDVLEAGEGAQMPSHFANINAFTGVVSGLLEVAILEGWSNPMFIAGELGPDEPSRQFEGRKTIGISRVGDEAEERQPGMPTKRVKVGERWITQPRTVENALAIEVTQEAVFLDLTGQLTSEANDLGTWLGYREEMRTIDAFIGVTNTYTYKDTAFNTYQASGTWDNDFSNELLHESDLDEALIKFRDMTDPDTGTRVLIQPNTMLIQPGCERVAAAIVGPTAAGVEYRDNNSATTPNQIRVSDAYYKGRFKLIASPLVYERITAADGLNQTASDAIKWWWLFESGAKTFVRVVNWPMRTQTAAPGQLDMIDRGIVLYVKADCRTVPMWKEPRRVVRNKN